MSHVFDGYSPEVGAQCPKHISYYLRRNTDGSSMLASARPISQALFGLLNVRPACQKAYHTAINHDPEASIPDWDLDTRSRTLTYFKPLDAPAMIRKLAGADALRVVDIQSVSRQASPEGSILLTSNPIPEMPGANKFQAPVRMVYRRCADDSCEVHGNWAWEGACTAAHQCRLGGQTDSVFAPACPHNHDIVSTRSDKTQP